MIPSMVHLPLRTLSVTVVTRSHTLAQIKRRQELVQEDDLLDSMLRTLSQPPFLLPDLNKALTLCGTSNEMRQRCLENHWKPLCAKMGWKVPHDSLQATAMVGLYHDLWQYTKAVPLSSFKVMVTIKRERPHVVTGDNVAPITTLEVGFYSPEINQENFPPVPGESSEIHTSPTYIAMYDVSHRWHASGVIIKAVAALGLGLGKPQLYSNVTDWFTDREFETLEVQEIVSVYGDKFRTLLGMPFALSSSMRENTAPGPYGNGGIDRSIVTLTFTFTHAFLEAQRELAGF